MHSPTFRIVLGVDLESDLLPEWAPCGVRSWGWGIVTWAGFHPKLHFPEQTSACLMSVDYNSHWNTSLSHTQSSNYWLHTPGKYHHTVYKDSQLTNTQLWSKCFVHLFASHYLALFSCFWYFDFDAVSWFLSLELHLIFWLLIAWTLSLFWPQFCYTFWTSLPLWVFF